MVFPPEASSSSSHDDDDDPHGLLTLLATIIAIRNNTKRKTIKKDNNTPRVHAIAAWSAAMAGLKGSATTDDSGWSSCNDDYDDDDDVGDDDDDSPRRVKRRRCVHPKADYYASPWAVVLRSAGLADSTSREAALFRGWFRVPHVFFLELVELAKDQEWFALAREDVAARQCIPVELKVKPENDHNREKS